MYSRVFGIGKNGGQGPGAGVCWLDFAYLDPTAPKQIVGHTKRSRPQKKGNVIRLNNPSPGGEGVLNETPTSVESVQQSRNGGVMVEIVAGEQ